MKMIQCLNGLNRRLRSFPQLPERIWQMTDSKPWYLSRTVWAAVVTILVALLGLLGVPTDGFDDAAFVDTLLQAATAVAGVVALLGRLAARARIG
jgi:hypothetical protein